ncbi:MAG: hypothetical protein K8R21_14475, partial [Leptospira sp.]|nr:hypothetical protein [Leptospira sp.]
FPKVEIHPETSSDPGRLPDYCERIPVINGVASDPIKNETTIYPVKAIDRPLADGSFLVHYLDKNTYYPGERIAIHAYLSDLSGKKKTGKKFTAILTESGGIQGKILDSVEMKDGGGAFDISGDSIYTGIFSSSKFTKDPHNYDIIVRYKDGMNEMNSVSSFNFGSLNLELIPKSFEESVLTSDFLLKFKVRVKKKGNYYFEGSLYSPQSWNPVGRAFISIELEEGEKTNGLKCNKKLYCDEKINGQLVLKYFLFANTTTMPGPRSQRFENLFLTQDRNWKKLFCDRGK